MPRSIAVTRTIVIIAGLLQLVLGMAFWAGALKGLVPVHMAIGTILVVSLWVLAYFAAKAGVGRGLVVLAVVWGLVVPVVGVAQAGILRGSAHWVVQVVHLLLGLGAMGVASVLASRAARQSVAAGAAGGGA
jgi:hypothetical protein